MRRVVAFFTLIVLMICTANFQQAVAGELHRQRAEYSGNSLAFLRRTATAVARDTTLRFGEWGLAIMDVATGEMLVEINSDKSLEPASNLKLFTTAAGLKYLGPDFRFKTRLNDRGEIRQGLLRGDIVIVGGGDPTLGSNQVTGSREADDVVSTWVTAVQQAGIRQIRGDIVADISYFDPITIPDGWLWMDIGNYYGAGATALCFMDNQYYLFFQPAKNVGDPASIITTKPAVPGLSFVNCMSTGPVGSGDNGYIYGGPGEMMRLLHGTIPAGVAAFSIKGSLPDPALFCAQMLKTNLQQNGVSVSGDARVSCEPASPGENLTILYSPPLRDIVYWINKKSINLYTEVLLKHLGKIKYGQGSFEQGILALNYFLTEHQISLSGMHLFDGCGLSPLDVITPRQMTLLLRVMAQDSLFIDFYNSLPIVGSKEDDGHLGHLAQLCRGTAAENNVRAKTGLIERVRAHSGYVHSRSGRLLCFAMIANDYSGSWRQIDRLHAKMMIAMANLE